MDENILGLSFPYNRKPTMIARMQPKIPKIVDLIKAGASLSQERTSEENKRRGIAKGIAKEAMLVCKECISLVSGIKPVIPNVQPII